MILEMRTAAPEFPSQGYLETFTSITPWVGTSAE
jgi:hypothetical protein